MASMRMVGGFQISNDELLAIVVPVFVFWVYSGIYLVLESYFESYRFHTKEEEDEKNLVPRRTVIKGVLLQQLLQAMVTIIVFKVMGDSKNNAEYGMDQRFSLILVARQFIIAMLVMDTWLYFMHRYLHQNRFLYRHLHSQHHQLVVPYAYGAIYGNPLEMFLLDIVGGNLAILFSGMSPRTSIFFFSFVTVKSVDDHSGLWLPGNLFHVLFRNNTAYHFVHHQLYGIKYNFSTPFFVMWDKILGTYMPYSVEERAGGGFEIRHMVKEKKGD